MTPPSPVPKRFSMIREFHLADWFTLGNAVCGVGALFSVMSYLETNDVLHVYFACALVLAALIFDVLDGRIARPNHEDIFVLKSVWIGEGVCNVRQILSWHTNPPWSSLNPIRKNHAFGGANSMGGFNLEDRPDLLNLLHFLGLHAHARPPHGLVPAFEHLFARRFFKWQGRANREPGRLGHDMLSKLIIVDGVADLAFLKDHVRELPLGRPRPGAQTARSSAHNRNPIVCAHVIAE